MTSSLSQVPTIQPLSKSKSNNPIAYLPPTANPYIGCHAPPIAAVMVGPSVSTQEPKHKASSKKVTILRVQAKKGYDALVDLAAAVALLIDTIEVRNSN